MSKRMPQTLAGWTAGWLLQRVWADWEEAGGAGTEAGVAEVAQVMVVKAHGVGVAWEELRAKMGKGGLVAEEEREVWAGAGMPTTMVVVAMGETEVVREGMAGVEVGKVGREEQAVGLEGEEEEPEGSS